MLPQADADAPTLRGEIQLLFTCQPADAREHQLVRQLRALFRLAECQLAVLIQISPVYIPFTKHVEDAKVTLAKEMKAQGIGIDRSSSWR